VCAAWSGACVCVCVRAAGSTCGRRTATPRQPRCKHLTHKLQPPTSAAARCSPNCSAVSRLRRLRPPPPPPPPPPAAQRWRLARPPAAAAAVAAPPAAAACLPASFRCDRGLRACN
jgi:hypothetical protein